MSDLFNRPDFKRTTQQMNAQQRDVVQHGNKTGESPAAHYCTSKIDLTKYTDGNDFELRIKRKHTKGVNRGRSRRRT